MTKSLTILIVDDETAVRRALQRWLSRTGNVVLEAGSGEEALDVLGSARNVDAVFLDLRLPTMSGRTLYHSIAARRPELATRTIIMSGDVDESHAGFSVLNRGKESLVVRYETPEGAEVIRRLVARADVFVESNRPGVLKRFGLDYESVKHDKLIYCSLSGYGQQGGLAQRAGHDINFIARNAVFPGDPPVLPFQLADLTGGMLAVIAILAALYDGKGRHLDVSLADGTFLWSSLGLARELLALAPARDPLDGSSPGYRYYRCQDGRWISVGALEGKFQQRLGQMLAEDWEGPWPEEIFQTGDPGLHQRLSEVFARRPLAEWTRRAAEADACVEPVQTLAELASDPWLRERGLVRTVSTLTQGEVEQPGCALDPAFGLTGGSAAAPPGWHTGAVLEELGYSSSEIDQLASAGVVVRAEE